MNSRANKKMFILKLNFLLMFHFNDIERRNIIEDYEEWYGYQLEHGKEDNQKPLVFEKPGNIVKNLCKEKERCFLGSRSILFRILFLIICFFTIQFLVGVCLRQQGRNAFGILFVNNIVQTMVGIWVFDAYKATSKVKKTTHLLVFVFAIVFLIGWMFIVPSFDSVRTGEICSITGNTLWFCLLVLCLMYVVYNFEKELYNSYVFTIHITGLASVIIHLVGVLNIYISSLEQMKIYFAQAILLYVETLSICFVLYLRGKFIKKKE